MRKVLSACFLTSAAAGLLLQAHAFAQDQDTTTYRLTGTRIAIGQDVRIERDEEVTDAAVVVAGNLEINGRVRDGVVVVGGNLHLTPTADIRGDVVLVGGTLTRDAGSQLSGAVNYVSFGEWSRRNLGFWPGVRFGEVGRWISLAGTIARISVLSVLMVMMLLVARAPVARVGRAAIAEPLRAFLIGFAAEVFFVPFLVAASIGLAITIIGIPFVAILVPIAMVIAVFAFVLGFTALACRIGEAIEDRFGWQPGNAFVATAIGFFILLAPTLLARFVNVASISAAPLAFVLVMIGLTVEFIAWTIGLGAAILTGLGRWYTVPPPIVAPPIEPAAGAPAF
ncbi:MAG TPA: hypothetical protein VM096_01340 [Vicinamibacterales bacterium]|nr:hypothetical protein [Vicinamibacterales bacterium]